MDPNPTLAIRQSDLPTLLAAGRLGDYPVAARTARELAAGGFADQARHPYAWTVHFLVDGAWAQVESARGHRREWTSLDRLEKWLRAQGFRWFWVRNDVEPAEAADAVSQASRLK